MGNPIFNMLNRSNQQPAGNNMSFIQRFNQFKEMFQGNPEQQVKSLLASGQMSQEQFNQLSSMAKQFQTMMGQRR